MNKLFFQFLVRTPYKRLGSGENGPAQIQAQPFYRRINWVKLTHREVQPPNSPITVSQSFTSIWNLELIKNNFATDCRGR